MTENQRFKPPKILWSWSLKDKTALQETLSVWLGDQVCGKWGSPSFNGVLERDGLPIPSDLSTLKTTSSSRRIKTKMDI